VRYSLRSLRKSPVFTTVAILTLALGIGANIAIFSLIDSILLSALPVKHPEQLFFLRTNSLRVGMFNVSTTLLYRDLEQMEKRATQIEAFAATDRASRLNIAVNGHAEVGPGDFVSGNYFQVLGVQPQIGRALEPADNLQTGGQDGGWPAVISDSYWRRRFAGALNAIGQRITINTIPFVIVGVLPPNFSGLSIDESADILIPAVTHNQVTSGSTSAGFPKAEQSPNNIFVRLKPGASTAKAAAELTVIFRSTEELADNALTGPQREAMAKRHIELDPAAQGLSSLRRSFAEPLGVLMVIVALILLIACANIAGLLLARANARQKETAIRLSLGCSRRRILRQWLTESLILSGIGCAIGVPIAIAARTVVVKLGGAQTSALGFDWDHRLLTFIVLICVSSALLFGVVPALRQTRVDPHDALKSSTVMPSSARLPFGRMLVSAQLAISLVLVAGSGLLLVTLHNLYNVELGFNVEHLLMMTLDPRLSGYDDAHTQAIYVRLLQELNRLPSIKSATLINNPLLTGRAHLSHATFPGYKPRPDEDLANSWILSYGVGPRFFETFQMPLMAGRDFTEADNENAPPVIVVNEALVQHYFAGQNPIGKQIELGSIFKSGQEKMAEIVGVVHNAHYFDVKDERQSAIFTALFQVQPQQFGSAQTLMVRGTGDPAQLVSDVRAVVQRIDPSLSLFNVRAMKTQLDRSLGQTRLLALLSSFFGALALLLSAVGLYGVLAYGVSKRTGEIGIRMALGADRSSITRLILSDTVQVLAIGICIGLGLSWTSTRLIKSMLYGLTPHDVRTFALSALVLTAVAVLASLIPARRAVQLDPMIALRYE
jgi:predicted permease